MKKVEIDNLEEWYNNIKENGCILSEHQSNSDGSKDYWGFADAEEEAEEEFDTLANHGGIYCVLENVLYYIDVAFYPFTIYDVYQLEKGDEALIPLFSSLYEYPIDFSKLDNENPSDYNPSLKNWKWLLDCLSEKNKTEDFSWYTYRTVDDIPETVDEVFYESLINFLIR